MKKLVSTNNGNVAAPKPAAPAISVPAWLEHLIKLHGFNPVRTALHDVLQARLRETLSRVTGDIKLEELQALVKELQRVQP